MVLQSSAARALCRGAGRLRRAVAFPFRSRHRHRILLAQCARHRLELPPRWDAGAGAGDRRIGMEADKLQFPVLPRRPAIDPEIADRGRGDRWCRRVAALLEDHSAAPVANRLFPPCRRHRLRVLRYVRRDRRRYFGRSGQRHPDSRLQGLLRRAHRTRYRRLGRTICHPHGGGHRVDRDSIPLRRAQGALLMTRRRIDWLPHLILLLGVGIVAFPIYVTLVASTLPVAEIEHGPMPLVPGTQAAESYRDALFMGSTNLRSGAVVTRMLLNSLVMAVVIAVGKIAISIISAYAVVFFRFPLRMVFFWMIFVTLMLPVEVRIMPTYKVVADLGMVDTYWGLTIPLIASATATLLFRQFFLTVPDELVEAAQIDGAGPLRFFWDTVLPLSRTNI